jgi:DNA modification methylase
MSSVHLYPGDCLAVLPRFPVNTFDALITDPPASIGFMGQVWDGDKGGRRQWVTWLSSIMQECLRVLKPGAHALVWAIPHRSHWTAWALEDAGFEIRDCIHRYFLSGFPKSLSLDKAIDKKLGATREVIGSRKAHDIRDRNLVGSKKTMTYEYTAATSPQAKQWEGWGTHLKPAIEHWWLVRKPLSEKTVAENVLKWGTGALNIGACRIPAWHETKTPFPEGTTSAESIGKGYNGKPRPADLHPDSRYPSHFIVSDWELLGDRTGFFHPPIYWPKARRCRGEGNHHPTVKPVGLMKYFCTLVTRPGGHVLDPFAGSFTTGVACQQLGLVFTGIEMKPDYVQIGLRRLGA